MARDVDDPNLASRSNVFSRACPRPDTPRRAPMADDDGADAERDDARSPARAFAHAVPARASTSACRDDNDGSLTWLSKSRHFIACTRAGKPTYARYGDAYKLSALCAALCALYDASRDHGDGKTKDAAMGDGLRAIVAPGRVVAFHATEYMLYVVTSSIKGESERTLHAQLAQFRRVMESLVTNAALEHALARNAKFDVGRALEARAHADVALATAIRSMSWDTSYVFNTYRTFALAAPIRRSCMEAIRASMTFTSPFAGAVFSSDGRLGAYAKPRGNRPVTIAASDMIVLMNHVRVMREIVAESSTANEEEADDDDVDEGASFERLCLPAFNANGFMHAYVAPLSRDTPSVIVCFLTASADARAQCKAARETLYKKLDENTSLAAIVAASEKTMDASTLPPEAFGGFTDARDSLLHFVYNRPVREQHISSTFSASLNVKDVKTLARAYAALYASMKETDADAFNIPPNLVGTQRVRYEQRERFNILSCVGGDFEIYLTLKSDASVVVAVALCNRLCVYLRVSEPELFLSPT